MPARRESWGLLAALLVLAPVAKAFDEGQGALIPGESRATASRLAEADRRLAEKRWAEALDELQGILDNSGDDLVPVSPALSVRARRLVHARIAVLPSEALKRYRDRVDAHVRRMLDQGASERDVSLLRRVVEEAFCSRAGERALELLGDLAFEQGHFAEAQAWWEFLAPSADTPSSPAKFAYPNPRGDVARIRAKQLMAQHFQGNGRQGRPLEAYRAKYPTAEGVLGGRKGKYADLLVDVFADQEALRDVEPDWATFGGDAMRGKLQPAVPRVLDRISILCRGGAARHVSLPSLLPLDGSAEPPEKIGERADFSSSLSFHPLIVGNRLLVADATRVIAFDLRNTSNPAVELYSLGLPAPPLRVDLHYTLSVAEGCVYARLGQPAVGEKQTIHSAPVKAFESRIVCLRLDPAPGEARVRWVERGLSGTSVGKRGKVIFEGAPIVRDGLVYALATRFEASRSVTAIHCYAVQASPGTAVDTEPEPILLWHADVAATREPDVASRVQHRLLTLAGSLVVCCTDNGVVVAVDAATGRLAWAAHYQGRVRELDDKPRLTDLAPCVHADGRIYAAPTDGGDLFCLEAVSGRMLWRREAIDVVHLLGVGAGRLIFTTPTGLRAVGAESGGDAEGWSHAARTDYGKDGSRIGWMPAGRGFLAGEYVFWPVIDVAGDSAVHAVRQDDGEPDDNPTLLHRVPVGNLVFAEGCLAVAGRDELSVFVPPAWQLQQRERGARAAPRSAGAALALARSEADAGFFRRAAETYARVEKLASRMHKLQREARSERQHLWLDAGRTAIATENWSEAKNAFDKAAGSEFAPAARAAALLEAGKAWRAAGRVAETQAAIHTVNDSDELRDARLSDLTRAREAVAQLGSGLHHTSEAAIASKEPVNLDTFTRIFPIDSVFRAAADHMRVAPTKSLHSILPLGKTWEVELDSAEELLPSAGDDIFLTCKHGTPVQLIARDVASGSRRWCISVPFLPTWAGGCFGRILIAGQDGILAVRRDDGAWVWDCLLPERKSVERLSQFRLSGRDLFCFHGGRRLVIFDAVSGERRQSVSAPESALHLRPDAGWLLPYYLAGSQTFVQSSDCACQEIDSRNGRLSKEYAGAGPWASDPISFGAGAVSVEGDRRIVYSGSRLCGKGWSYTVPGVTTLSGRPPRVAAVGDTLLLLVEANIGYQLQRLDGTTGKPLWSVPVLLREPVTDPSHWAAGEGTVCLFEGGFLTSISLQEGKRVREVLLGEPGRAWHVDRLPQRLLAYPLAVTARHFAFRWLTSQLQWTVMPDVGEAVGRGFPLVACDLAGRVTQRFDFAVRSPALLSDCAPYRNISLMPLPTVWRGVSSGCPAVQVFSRGVIVVVGPHARGLTLAATK